jgi:hypothetical protein
VISGEDTAARRNGDIVSDRYAASKVEFGVALDEYSRPNCDAANML